MSRAIPNLLDESVDELPCYLVVLRVFFLDFLDEFVDECRCLVVARIPFFLGYLHKFVV